MRLLIEAETTDPALLKGFLEAMRGYEQQHPDDLHVRIVGECSEMSVEDVKEAISGLNLPFVTIKASTSTE